LKKPKAVLVMPLTGKTFVILIALPLLMTACAPQAELVKTRSDMSDLREDVKTTKARVQELQRHLDKESQALQRKIDTLEASTKGTGDVQKSLADFGAKNDQLAMDIQLLQGKLEENNFRLAEIGQKLDDRGVKLAELAARVDELEAKVKLLSGGTGTVASLQAGTTTAAKTIEPSEAYRQAKSDYDAGRFELALAGFQNYVNQFPNTTLTDKAQYWIGECYYSMRDFDKAIGAFNKVLHAYPKSDKVAGAKLKIGLSYVNERNSAKAKEYLRKVIKEHPGTNEAQIAKSRLAKLGR
jgi:tol-pal system protein YbgF